MACEGLPRQREGGQIESSANISYNDLDLVRNIESNGTIYFKYEDHCCPVKVPDDYYKV